MASSATDSEISSKIKSEEVFKRMVINDKMQNQFLKSKLSKGSAGSYGVTSKAGERSTGMRFVVVTLGVVSLAMSMMSRSAINNCITSMVNTNGSQTDHGTTSPISIPTEAIPAKATTDSVEVESGLNKQGSLTTLDPMLFYLTTVTNDQHTTLTTSSPSETFSTETAISTTATTTAEYITTMASEPPMIVAPQVEKLNWSIKEQSLVKGGFYYSYFVFMVLGGRMSEIYGAKYVLLLGVAGSAIINLATPWMARYSLTMLVMSRTIMGAIQSGVFPAMYALINKWLTMSEASIYAPMVKMSLRTGGLLASLLPGLISNWPDVFYIVGGLGVIWSALWLLVATSEPSQNRWVTKTELKHILKKKRSEVQSEAAVEENGISMAPVANGKVDKVVGDAKEETSARKQPLAKKTPWIKIITSPSVLGLIFAKLFFNCFNDFVQIELPSYLKYVHDASRQRISAITTTMFTIQVSLVVCAGWLAKVMIQKRPFKLSITTIRKLFQSIASFGSGALMFMLTYGEGGLTYITVVLQLISVVSVFVAGGETMLPYDLSEEYPATIMAIANSVANLSGIMVTALTSFVLGDQGGSQSRWNTVIGIIGAFDILGGLLFCLLVKAEPINFARNPKKVVGSSVKGVEEEDIEKAPSYEAAVVQEGDSEPEPSELKKETTERL